MDKSYFNILQSVVSAYRFVGREWRYLATIGLIPAVINVASTLFVHMQVKNASLLSSFLMALPATLLSAWFMFVEIRLIVLGEKANALPQDPAFLSQRQQKLQAAIFAWLLFSMALTAISAFMGWAIDSGKAPGDKAVTAACFALAGMLFWGLRFSVMHLLIAVDYPVRKFIFRVNGMMFSLRLLAMGFLCSVPVVVLLQAVIGAIMPRDVEPSATQISVLVGLSAFLSFIMTVLLTAAAGFALKQILSRPEGRVKTA